MKGNKAAVLLLGALLWAPGILKASAITPPMVEPGALDFTAPLVQRANELAATRKPLELLIASLLAKPAEASAMASPSSTPSQSDAWLAQAIALGSDQPVIARAAVSRCISSGQCDIPVAINTLRTQEADDAVAQLLLWQMAVREGDASAAASAWARVAQASRVEDEYAQYLGLLDRMTIGMRLPIEGADPGMDPDEPRQTMLYALAAALTVTWLAPVHRECPATKGVVPKQGCLRLAALMADSTSALVSSFGISKMKGYALDETEQKRWQERKRQLDWLIHSAAALQGTGSNATPTEAQHYLRWISENGELPAMRQLLAVHGVATQPPTDWQPSLLAPK
ncbi:hypothetical protein [Stenotrophomonas sp.]|uniref:hypothetical protein n=1 Tax=Stenotrophomonas sp. TaxID=69392 RepID=UPI0028AF9577|nr:hypothetical protein [Stenotrophomonas sp.]